MVEHLTRRSVSMNPGGKHDDPRQDDTRLHHEVDGARSETWRLVWLMSFSFARSVLPRCFRRVGQDDIEELMQEMALAFPRFVDWVSENLGRITSGDERTSNITDPYEAINRSLSDHALQNSPMSRAICGKIKNILLDRGRSLYCRRIEDKSSEPTEESGDGSTENRRRSRYYIPSSDYIDPVSASMIADGKEGPNRTADEPRIRHDSFIDGLTPRQWEIIGAKRRGLDDRTIMVELEISSATLDSNWREAKRVLAAFLRRSAE
jgi:hypothetical protein